jgi:hypothetical protein
MANPLLQLPDKPKRRTGRRSTKTPEACQKIIEAVRTGLPLKFAAACAGLTDEGLRLWRERDPKFAQELEIARLTSVKERWEIIQAAARGNGDTPGDWKAAAWSVERTWPKDFGRPEFQLNLQNNVQNVTNNNFTITIADAERLQTRVRAMEASVEELFAGKINSPGV